MLQPFGCTTKVCNLRTCFLCCFKDENQVCVHSQLVTILKVTVVHEGHDKTVKRWNQPVIEWVKGGNFMKSVYHTAINCGK